MKWAYIIYLPMVAALVWPLLMIALKRRLTSAQLFLGLMLLVEAAATGMFAATFRQRTGMVLVYDILFQIAAICCAPVYYLGVCALTEARGVSRTHRRVLMIPLVYAVGVVASLLMLGRLEYDTLSVGRMTGKAVFEAGARVHNFALFWTDRLFQVLFFFSAWIIIVVCSRKLKVFERRFNGFYATTWLNSRPLRLRYFRSLVWLFPLVATIVITAVAYRYDGYIVVLSLVAVLVALAQLAQGYFIYHLDIDAATLAAIVRKHIRNAPSSSAAVHARRSFADIGRQMCRYVESEGYRTADLSVVDLALRYHLSQDEVVDLIHSLQGLAPSDYFDSVRIEHSIPTLLADGFDVGDTMQMMQVAVDSGFVSMSEYEQAFRRVMQMTVKQYVAGGGKLVGNSPRRHR